MKNFFSLPVKRKNENPALLHNLVGSVIKDLLPFAVARRSFFINNIQAEIPVVKDEYLLTLMMTKLLNKAISDTRQECIRIETASTSHSALIKVKDNDGRFYNDISKNMEEIQVLARKLGMIISIHRNENIGTIARFNY